MQSAAGTKTLIATCFRCQARFSEAAPAACPGCGGGVILEMERGAAGASVRPDSVAAERAPTRAGPEAAPPFLPGVHIKRGASARWGGAGAAQSGARVRRGGGTSIHAPRSARPRGSERRGGLALRFLSMAAVMATFAVMLQGLH